MEEVQEVVRFKLLVGALEVVGVLEMVQVYEIEKSIVGMYNLSMRTARI